MSMTVQHLEDKDAIRELLARYCVLHAAHDFAGVAALFTDDGRFENIVGVSNGPAQIQRMYETINPPRSAQLERKHFNTDVTVALAGDEATALSQFLLVRQSDAGLMVAACGRYEDRLARTAAGWRFAARQVHVDFQSDLGLRKVP